MNEQVGRESDVEAHVTGPVADSLLLKLPLLINGDVKRCSVTLLTKGKIKARSSALLYRRTTTGKSQDSHVHWLESQPGAASERHSWKPLATPKMFTYQSRTLSPETFPEKVRQEIVYCCKHTSMNGHKLKRRAIKAGY